MEPIKWDEMHSHQPGEEHVLDLGKRVPKLSPRIFSVIISALDDYEAAWQTTIKIHNRLAFNEKTSAEERALSSKVIAYAQQRLAEVRMAKQVMHNSGFDGESDAEQS